MGAFASTAITPTTATKPLATASDWGNELYSGAKDIGIFKADAIMVVALVVASVLVVLGFIMAVTDDSYKYQWVKGTIIEPNCTKASATYDDKGRKVKTYKCSMTVAYEIKGKVLQKKIYLTGNETYIKDEPIELVVMKSNPDNVQLAYTDGSTMGGMLFLSSVVIVALAYLNYYMSHKYSVFAVAQGTSTVFGLFR